MKWLRKHWKTIAGAVCGAAAPVVAVTVNPIAGVALGAVCTAAFGANATKVGEQLGKPVAGELEKRKDK
jgi:hypothetical protein